MFKAYMIHVRLARLFTFRLALMWNSFFRSRFPDQSKFKMVQDALLFSESSDHMLFCGLGILVSVYALYVETRKHRDKTYKAVCDLGENMSCSRVLTSR